MVLLVLLAFGLSASSSGEPKRAATSVTPNASAPCGTQTTHPGVYSHVIWIVFENKPYSSIIGSWSAPYINSLANKCGLATNYYAITHPSLPNYLAMTGGSTFGVTDGGSPSSHKISNASIFSQLGASGWRSLQESMPSNCYLWNYGQYAVRHNPAAYFTSIRTACQTQDVPYSSSQTPNILARFTLVTPNMCNDMHNCSVATGDKWLSVFLPKILNSPQYGGGYTAVVVTFDEGSSTSNRIATVLIAPSVRVGARSSTSFNHYGLLRTTESMLGLACLANACSATSLRSAFNL